jgi:hypothetical protein
MAAIDPTNPGDDLWRSIEEGYWEKVGAIIRKIFQQSPELVQDFRRQLIDATPLERSLILHDDPLEVAADIAGVEMNESHLRRYRELFDNE